MLNIDARLRESGPAPARGTACATFARRCAYAFMLSMPWAAIFAERLNPHDVARMCESVVMLAAAWAWWQASAQPHRRPGWERLGRAAIAGLAAASTLAAPRFAYAALELSAWALLLMVAIVFARSTAAELRRELPPVLALAGLVSVVMELPRWVFFLSDGRLPHSLDLGFMYMSTRFFNHAQTMILPLLLIPLLLPVPRWARVAAWVGLCGGLALLFHSGGRGTVIAFTTFALALPWLLRERSAEVLRLLARATLGAIAVYALMVFAPAWAMTLSIPQEPHLGTRLAGLGVGGRRYLWGLAQQGLIEHPWLGVGPMHFAYGENREAAHPHNALVQAAMEWGVPATLLALAAAAVAVRRSLLAVGAPGRDTQGRSILAIATLATVAGGVDSMVSGTLVMPVSQVWWAVALGVMLSGHACGGCTRNAATWRLPVAIGVVALHVALSVLTYRQATLAERDPRMPHPIAAPRYWGSGFFF